MKKILWVLPALGLLILIAMSCSDNDVMSVEEQNQEKKEEITEKAGTFLPDELLEIYKNQIDLEMSDKNDQEYLDTLNTAVNSLLEVINEHSSIDEFKQAVNKQYSSLSKTAEKKGVALKDASCKDNFRLGYSRSAEFSTGGSASLGAKYAAQLESMGGGGIDYIYDFVNLDRGVYTYSFCGFGAGIGLGVGAGFSTNVGFTGLRKWLWNIPTNQQATKNRFEGPARSTSFGISGELSFLLGLDASVNIGRVIEIEWNEPVPQLENLSQCPSFMKSTPKHDGVREAGIAVSVGASSGASFDVVGLLTREVLGTNRIFVPEGYTDYNSRFGRLASSLNMARELVLPEPEEFLYTGPALLAAATVTALGAFDPSDCPPPKLTPKIEKTEIIEIDENSATLEVNISDDGGANVTKRGVCWSEEQNPNSENDCNSEGSGSGEFTSTITNLQPNMEYYVRAYATNEMGTAYGSQESFTTDEEAGMPSVSTSSISSITENSAQSGGEVTDDGGASVTARGVCWSTSHNPTTSDDCSSDGSGTGRFTSDLTNLSSDTQYYVRAYATNNEGTAYGNQESFITETEDNGNGNGNGDWSRDTETEVVDVTSPTGRVWMDRNLGASRAANSMDDEQAYGDLYQWGRAADGHQKRNSGTTSTLSSSDQPGHGEFIVAASRPQDWRNPQNDNLWQGVNGVNNPCPVGYRLPTEAEWEEERQSWSSNNRVGAFESPLKLPVAGYRSLRDGSLFQVGSYGSYWSGSVSGSSARVLISANRIRSRSRAFAISVRCLKD